jgi:hypothetical protein
MVRGSEGAKSRAIELRTRETMSEFCIQETEKGRAIMNTEKGQHSKYNYSHFSPDLMVERFEGGPKPGEMAPDFTALTLDGNKVQLSDCRGRRDVVLQFGSVT